MAINIIEAMVQAEDSANKHIVDSVFSRSIRLMLFTMSENAQWAADKFIKQSAYPLASLSFIANSSTSKYQVGDNFKYSSTRLGISNMVFRIIKITENNLLSESINIEAIEDIEYISASSTYTNIPEGSSSKGLKNAVLPLTEVILLESPYVLSENNIQVIPFVSRETGQEEGFHIYTSLTGESYSRLGYMNEFVVKGTLRSEYPSDTYEVDNTIGFQVYIPNYASQLSSITEVELYGSSNFSILGNDAEAEMITWQTITPVSDDIYEITGVYRNRYGSSRLTHSIGTEFWFINQQYNIIENDNFTYGNTVYFKFVPYSGNVTGSLSEAAAYSITFAGISRRPYDPTNFGCCEIYVTPTYTDDCELLWSPRIRGEGLGFGNPDYVIENPSWEGLFEIEVYVSDILVRTTSDIDTYVWTYTSAMNISDNGSLADEITFKLRNYLVYEDIEYTSDWVTLTVNKE